MHPIDQLDTSNPDVLLSVITLFMKAHRDISAIHAEKYVEGSTIKVNIEITEGRTVVFNDKRTN